MARPLRLYEVGPYGELVGRPNPEGLVVLTVPDFEAMLPFLAEARGRALSPEEIRAARDLAPAIALTRQEAWTLMSSRHGRREA